MIRTGRGPRETESANQGCMMTAVAASCRKARGILGDLRYRKSKHPE